MCVFIFHCIFCNNFSCNNLKYIENVDVLEWFHIFKQLNWVFLKNHHHDDWWPSRRKMSHGVIFTAAKQIDCMPQYMVKQQNKEKRPLRMHPMHQCRRQLCMGQPRNMAMCCHGIHEIWVHRWQLEPQPEERCTQGVQSIVALPKRKQQTKQREWPEINWK